MVKYLAVEPTPEQIFDYCYGVLYDPNYRNKYDEYLKRDYPRVPIIRNQEVFNDYVNAGARLRNLHLMHTNVSADLKLAPANSDYMQIEKTKYKDGVLNINGHKQLLGISPEVWDYRIGGYQVLEKWFKSHRGEKFVLENFEHISKVVAVLTETLKIQRELESKSLIE